ncbi:alpha/beta hydrolase [Hoyosella rhizosphaerae]|uniref:AB hydrolase-1 domain-containing protein n=1 Tax=Hoyosella rhizosphaerae TaxID=1755582 RepID=A0A916UAS4_9ACTN|nr:alpha/beta hydrolase [Hoyosella rhizosphaerae]MBN4926115.1 alpha/beta hydrolase [Hoyosella rhizosphaerae]GGC65472.1 hypothetical protein GCM10011410_17420 [Hoyosella rhizosphaerae]
MTETLHGVRLIEQGEGDDLVLLLHGFSDSADSWHRVQPALAAHARVIALDLPGFGAGSAVWPSPLLENYRAAITEIIESRSRGGNTSIIGNSLGAVVALLVATERPDLVHRIVLSDMPGLRGIPRLWSRFTSIQSERVLLRTVGRLPNYPATLLFLGLFGGAARRRKMLDSTARKAISHHYERKETILSLVPKARDVMRELSELPVEELVRTVEVPALLVWGADDILTPARVAQSFEWPANISVVVIERCGHCPQLDRPRTFVSHVHPFIFGSNLSC